MICSSETAGKLIDWFRIHRRFMPWREDPTPYHVWVSEIMLQQTRVDTVMPYYDRFIAALPDVRALAACPEDELCKLWEGLGYYSRVRNMKKAAEMIVRDYDGEIPADFQSLIKLPGIGSYTAGAISSIAFHRKTPVVDGNVLRVISRLNGLRDDIGLPETKKKFEEGLGGFLLENDPDPSEFNQGLMELGALICVPNGAPLCEKCPWNDRCIAGLNHETDRIPVKAPKKDRKVESLTVFMIRDAAGKLAILKRPDTGLLSGMYGLPLAEGKLTAEEAEARLRLIFSCDAVIRCLPEKKHVFTHIEWKMQAFSAVLPMEISQDMRYEWERETLIFAEKQALEQDYALPSAFKKWELSE